MRPKKQQRRADIFRDRSTGDIVVTDRTGSEVFRHSDSPQIISIAHAIYMSEKYGGKR